MITSLPTGSSSRVLLNPLPLFRNATAKDFASEGAEAIENSREAPRSSGCRRFGTVTRTYWPALNGNGTPTEPKRTSSVSRATSRRERMGRRADAGEAAGSDGTAAIASETILGVDGIPEDDIITKKSRPVSREGFLGRGCAKELEPPFRPGVTHGRFGFENYSLVNNWR